MACRALVLIGLCVLAPQALAQALAIVPINQQLTPQQRSASFTLTNQSDSEALVQIRGYAWSQTEHDDLYSPTAELAVSPPFAKIAPGQKQVIRILLRSPAGLSEKAYRVVFDQIPDRLSGKVEMALRLTVPVFSTAQPAGHPDVQWQLQQVGAQLMLVAINRGTQHAQLINLTLTAADGHVIKLKATGLPYLLSGTQRKWPLEGVQVHPGQSTRVHVQTSGPGEHWDQWLELHD
jgi:fimbrial chaperone protein